MPRLLVSFLFILLKLEFRLNNVSSAGIIRWELKLGYVITLWKVRKDDLVNISWKSSNRVRFPTCNSQNYDPIVKHVWVNQTHVALNQQFSQNGTIFHLKSNTSEETYRNSFCTPPPFFFSNCAKAHSIVSE